VLNKFNLWLLLIWVGACVARTPSSQNTIDLSTHHLLTQMNPLSGETIAVGQVIDATNIDSQQNNSYPLTATAVIHQSTGKIVANSVAWIPEKELDAIPIDFKAPQATKEDSNTLLRAESAYEQKNYPLALQLFKLAATRQETLKTYVGLYETYRQLGDLQNTEQTFDKLLEVSVKENRRLNIKFLFSANQIEFIEDVNLRTQYNQWLHQISQFLKQHSYCFHIIGHSSRHGTPKRNHKLSWQRANKIQQLMKTEFPDISKWSKVVAKGSEENLIGAGTDDLRDAIDRRVEFLIVDCPI